MTILPKEIINAMDPDELRSYICHLHDVNDCLTDIIAAKAEEVGALRFELNIYKRHESTEKQAGAFTDRILQKYTNRIFQKSEGSTLL